MDVFVYGTLTDPTRVAALVDSYVFVGPALLRGFHPVEGRYPTLAPGGEVAGRILRTEEIDAIDAYEGVDRGLYARVEIPWADGGAPDEGAPDAVAAYVGDPERLGVAASVEWPGSGPLAERVERHVADAGATVQPID
ncbi:gamma-glutamylcyclotransferase family protein [Halegenticoccus tardaugens]|uniref:gamma-glutamylcyclotransferase family protein n=1 Tax=Halegenticoccus tardaugens TaxID=2071624 RepID=UPI00100A727F|nr:gamma-glutamylcyclotransferase family protein [Halegenticoccus tardaugens]